MTIADRIIQRTSEIKQKFNANRAASESLKQTIQKSLDSSLQNAKDIQQAQKNGKIADDKAQSATFLNNINQVLNESIAGADSSTLKSIDKNLEGIKKLIADYTKSSIDKQDTSIKKISKAAKPQAIASKSKGKTPKKDSKYGAWDWLKDLLMLGVGLLPLIWAAKSLFKIGLEIAKFGKSALNGILKGIGWLAANVKNLAKLTGTVITGVVKFFTAPVKWFMSNIWPALKGSVSGLIADALEKIPGLKQAKQVVNELRNTASAGVSKVVGGVKDAWNWGIGKLEAGKNFVANKFSALKSKIGQKIFSKFPGLEAKLEMFEALGKKALDKVKLFARKTLGFLDIVKRAGGGKLAGYSSKVLSILKTAAGKALARATTFITSVASGPAGWILSALLIGWGIAEMVGFWFKYGESAGWDNPKLYLFGVIKGLIGIDMWEEPEIENIWETAEPLTPEEANKLSANLSNSTIAKASKEQRSNYINQLDAEYGAYQNKFNSLLSKNIKYKDANGNLLSDEDSKKIQSLEIMRADLQAQRASIQSQYIDRLSNSNYYNGEVEISDNPEKFKKLIDYFYDDFAKRGMFDSWFGKYRDANLESLKKEFEIAKYQGEKAMREGKTLDAAKLFAKSQIYADMLKLAQSGITNLAELENAIKSKNRFQDHNEELNAITARLNDANAELSGFGAYTEHSSTEGAFKGAGLGTSKAMAAAKYAESNAKTQKPFGDCAKYVNDAIVLGGGYRNYGRGHGYQVGDSLCAIGWEKATGTARIGDVAVFDKHSTTNAKYGHTAILTKSGWVSDYKQGNEAKPRSYPADAYRHMTVYRDTGKSGVTALPKYDNNGTLAGTQNSGQSKSQETPQPQVVVANIPQSTQIPESTIDLTEYWELIPA